MPNRSPHRLGMLLASAGLLLLIVGVPRPAAAQQLQDPCEQSLAKADSNYTRGRFEAAVRLARLCLQAPNASDEYTIRAYRLLALAYLRQDSLGAAKEAIRQLLVVAPRYEPDPVTDPPAYFSLVAIVKKARAPLREPTAAQQESSSWFTRAWNWVWVSLGGAAAVGLTALVLAGGGGTGGGGGNGGPGELPPPPPPPN